VAQGDCCEVKAVLVAQSEGHGFSRADKYLYLTGALALRFCRFPSAAKAGIYAARIGTTKVVPFPVGTSERALHLESR